MMMYPLLADFDIEGILGVMIPIIALMIPIVAILVKHQQSMAQILHGGAVENERVAALSEEVKQLRQQIASLTLGLDDVRSQLPAKTASGEQADSLRSNLS